MRLRVSTSANHDSRLSLSFHPFMHRLKKYEPFSSRPAMNNFFRSLYWTQLPRQIIILPASPFILSSIFALYAKIYKNVDGRDEHHLQGDVLISFSLDSLATFHTKKRSLKGEKKNKSQFRWGFVCFFLTGFTFQIL